jgi:hypothetical protein
MSTAPDERAAAEEIVKLVTSRVLFARLGDASKDWALVLKERRALAVEDILPLLVAALNEATSQERRRLILLAREFGTESTLALADQLAQEELAGC